MDLLRGVERCSSSSWLAALTRRVPPAADQVTLHTAALCAASRLFGLSSLPFCKRLRSLLSRPHWADFRQGACAVPSVGSLPRPPCLAALSREGRQTKTERLKPQNTNMTTTPKNSLTRSGLQLHPEQASPDTNPNVSSDTGLKLFEVMLQVVEYRVATVFIRAENVAEAMRQAERSKVEDTFLMDTEVAATHAEAVDLAHPFEESDDDLYCDDEVEGGSDE